MDKYTQMEQVKPGDTNMQSAHTIALI